MFLGGQFVIVSMSSPAVGLYYMEKIMLKRLLVLLFLANGMALVAMERHGFEYKAFRDKLAEKIEQMPANVSISDINETQLEELKKKVGVNFANEYLQAARKNYVIRASQSLAKQFDGRLGSEESKKEFLLKDTLLNQIVDKITDDQKNIKARL